MLSVFCILSLVILITCSRECPPHSIQANILITFTLLSCTSFNNLFISMFFLTMLSMFFLIGTELSFLNTYSRVKQVSMVLAINMFATLALMESSTLFHYFLLLEVFLALSLNFLSGEQRIDQHALLYLIPNVIVGIVFLLATIITVLFMGTLDLSSLRLMSINLPSAFSVYVAVPSLLFSLVLLSKMFAFPFNLFLPQIYNNLTAPSLVFFSLSFMLPYYLISFSLLSIVPTTYLLLYSFVRQYL